MQEINYNTQNGTVIIEDQFSTTLDFSLVNQQQIVSGSGLTDVIKFCELYDMTTNETENRYLERWWRASVDNGVNYSEWYQITTKKSEETVTGATTSIVYKKNYFDISDFPNLDPSATSAIQIKWVRKGISLSGIISIKEYSIEGDIERLETTEPTIKLSATQSVIYSPPYVYKVFRIDDIELLSSNNDSIKTEWRYTQDNKRNWTKWEPLNKDNAISARINPIRFFEVEYQFTNKTTSDVYIYDFNIIGDFQNVSLDYLKSNLFGIRDNAQSIIASFSNTANDSDLPPSDGGFLDVSKYCGPLTDLIKPLNDAQKSQLFKPYALNQATDLLNVLANQATSILGFDVVYFATDADSNGIDHTFHEYQLLNVACDGVVKVSVDQNNFPDNQIVMNQFDLSLFDTFEIHITKENFKSIFGVQRRPHKDDFLYFPEISRMFRVEHAQPFRQFNNASIYYKVMLKKWSQLANVQITDVEISNKVKELTKNSTIDELFGLEATNDLKDVANKDQYRTLTRDVVRHKVLAKINKELIENSTLVLSKSNYDMNSVTYDTPAVTYTSADSLLQKGDNRAFMLWFKLNNYVINEKYNFINNYDDVNEVGYRIDLEADNINFTYNGTVSQYNLSGSTASTATELSEDVWYCYLLNLDQRQGKITHYIYKRNVSIESDAGNLGSSKLLLVSTYEADITPFEFALENVEMSVLGSDSNMTNIRLFNDVIAEDTHNKVLNQTIIRDSSALIFGDNANSTLILPSFDI
jgi:hypothetical protein